LRRNRAPHETQSEQNNYTRDRRKAGALLSTRLSGTLRRAEIFDGPVVRALRATPNQINRSFPSGVACNARTRIGNHAVVIGNCEEQNNPKIADNNRIVSSFLLAITKRRGF
jgi:hypothetical protein